nr:MAG TPA: hypothetical protein [Caudoviricetes sp.]
MIYVINKVIYYFRIISFILNYYFIILWYWQT